MVRIFCGILLFIFGPFFHFQTQLGRAQTWRGLHVVRPPWSEEKSIKNTYLELNFSRKELNAKAFVADHGDDSDEPQHDAVGHQQRAVWPDWDIFASFWQQIVSQK